MMKKDKRQKPETPEQARQEKHMESLRREHEAMAKFNRQFEGETPEQTFERFTRDGDERDAAMFALVRTIEQFENDQHTANDWISCRRIAVWRIGKGDPVADTALAAAYDELRRILCHADEGRPGRVMALIARIADSIGRGPTNDERWPDGPWYLTQEECDPFVERYGLARISDSGGFLVGGVWLRRDLAREIFIKNGWPLPHWLPDAPCVNVQVTRGTGKAGRPPKSNDEYKAELERWIAGGRELMVSELRRLLPGKALVQLSKPQICQALVARGKEICLADAKAGTLENNLRSKLDDALALF